MKDKIVDIEGKKFLMNFSDNSFLEIVDYNEPKINTLTPFSYIDTEETKSYFGDINYGKEKKKWGCINERNEVVIPCVYDNIDVCNNTFTGIKGLKRFDFDTEGVPIYKYRINGIEKTTRFTGWQYVERFDDKPISIGAKDGSPDKPERLSLFVCIFLECRLSENRFSLFWVYSQWGKPNLPIQKKTEKKLKSQLFILSWHTR